MKTSLGEKPSTKDGKALSVKPYPHLELCAPGGDMSRIGSVSDRLLTPLDLVHVGVVAVILLSEECGEDKVDSAGSPTPVPLFLLPHTVGAGRQGLVCHAVQKRVQQLIKRDQVLHQVGFHSPTSFCSSGTE